jgi:hypothetical protein
MFICIKILEVILMKLCILFVLLLVNLNISKGTFSLDLKNRLFHDQHFTNFFSFVIP